MKWGQALHHKSYTWLTCVTGLCSGWQGKLSCSSATHGGWEGSYREEKEQTIHCLCPCLLCQPWDGQAASPQERPTLFKFNVKKLTPCLWKRHQLLPKPPQTPQDISKSLSHPISNKGITESDCEISFPFICSPSVPCWQHKRIGKWKLSLRETLYRKKAFICLSLIVPWTFLEKMVALCQCICQILLWHEPHWIVCSGSLLLGTPWTFAADEEDGDLKIVLP